MTEPKTEEAKFEGFAILELMGHRRLGGYVRETSFAGAGMIRIDIPKIEAPCWEEDRAPANGEGSVTTYYSPSSLYALTPVRGPMARAVAKQNSPAPVTSWEIQASRSLPAAKEEVEVEPEPEVDRYPTGCSGEAGDGQCCDFVGESKSTAAVAFTCPKDCGCHQPIPEF